MVSLHPSNLHGVYSLNDLNLGLTGNLKSSSPVMYRIYLAMKEQSFDEITPEVVSIASGKTVLDPAAMAAWLCKFEETSTTIQYAFKKQLEVSAVPWDQGKFEELLTKWIVATDQPFSTVEDPEFREFVTYTHHPLALRVPHRDAIRKRVMKMGLDTRDDIRRMFKVRFLL
jgi:hypothetical protein